MKGQNNSSGYIYAPECVILILLKARFAICSYFEKFKDDWGWYVTTTNASSEMISSEFNPNPSNQIR